MKFLSLLFIPSGYEALLIFGAILLLFGGRKIPELMKGLGKGMREFNDAKESIKDELEAGMKDSNTSDSSNSQ